MTTELATRLNGETMPALSMDAAIERYNAVVEFTQKIMKAGKDYGKIPGTDKPTLLKPGAEKLCSFFGLSVDYVAMKEVEDWTGGFFYFCYKVVLTRHGEVIATGIGSCNSKEKKYRWRNADRKCPRCGKETILKSKNGPGYFCWTKKGGCGANFDDNDPAIAQQASGKVENTEPYDLVNTIQKMAQKRALVAATLIAANASEFYTQDVEDMEIIEGEFTAHDAPREREEDPQPQAPKPAPQQKQPPPTRGPLASKDDVKHLKSLLVKVTLPAGTVERWYSAAGVKSFDQLTADQIEKCIKFCESKLTTKDNVQTPEEKGREAREEYLKWYEWMESIAVDVGCPAEVFNRGMVKCMKNVAGKEWTSTAAQREQVEKALRDLAGHFAVPDEAVTK